MELQHINVKLFVEGDLKLDPARFIDVFHTWIREESLDELLIDVADYRHVPDGPGVMLVAHEADYCMENTGGRGGLRYSRKAPLEGTNQDRFAQALGAALKASQRLESQFSGDGPLAFSRRSFELSVNDRALAPNTAETFDSCKGDIQGFLDATFGAGVSTVEHQSDPRRRFAVVVTLAKPFDPASILSSLSGTA